MKIHITFFDFEEHLKMLEFDQALQMGVHATVCPFACVRVHEETVPRYETVA